ncbi:type III-B CRISPR module-associated protein Cmr5 [Caldimonas taiwanensis]|uniref:type III-B CRISPR module-associated protein Cmr5 n=1 Tax=Caldimonas taiwanensis TaxID=307483 RepID=UPI0018DD83CD|nr:type III-B CRISPR module-associated protein Cmr5 [Caldimonas taiwanensis]
MNGNTTKPHAMTLEQRRAAHAWSCVKDKVSKEYVNVAKAMPQLIMNSGLMQTLAFMEQKQGEYSKVASQLRQWLHERFGCTEEQEPDFKKMMDKLLHASPSEFRLYTTEALAWLKWLRQLASASQKSD